jgi:hypothetical protein
VKIVDVVQAWLPPGQAGRMLERAGEREAPAALESMAALSLYVLLVGGVLAARLRAEYRGENLGEAPALSTATKRQKKRLLDGSGPLAAVMEKEFQTMMRSARLLFALGVPVLMVLVIATLLRNGDSGAQHSILRSLDLPLCEAYALLGFTQLIYNTLGTEGTGIQWIFLSPTPIRTVMLAKNLFHGMLFGIVAVLAGVLTTARVGRPDWPVLAATAGWLVFALPANLAAGNILSLILPYRVNLGRMMHQAGSQGNGLFAMLIQAAILGVGISVYGVCSLFAHEWLAAPIFLALAGAAIIAWLRVLRHVDGMAGRRKDLLMDALAEAAK